MKFNVKEEFSLSKFIERYSGKKMEKINREEKVKEKEIKEEKVEMREEMKVETEGKTKEEEIKVKEKIDNYMKYNFPIALHPKMFVKFFRQVYKKGIQTGYEVGYSDAMEKMDIALEKVKNSWSYMNDKKIQELVFEKHRYADVNTPEYIMNYIEEFMKENGLG